MQLGSISMQSNDIVISLVTVLLLAGLWLVIQHTCTGVAMRAVSFNEKARAHGREHQPHHQHHLRPRLGPRGHRRNFYAMRSPGIDPLMGMKPGFTRSSPQSSAVSAICPRALGGLLLGLLETFAGGIPGVSNYRDGIAFAILILILLFKPAGLLGRLQPEKV